MSDNPSALERRCVDAYARASETTDYGTELNTLGIVRAVLAEAGVAATACEKCGHPLYKTGCDGASNTVQP